MTRTRVAYMAAVLTLTSNGVALGQSPSNPSLGSLSISPTISLASLSRISSRDLQIKDTGASLTFGAGKGGQGSLLLCGGSILPNSILDAFFERGRGGEGNLVIIPTASPMSDTGDSGNFDQWLALWRPYQWKSCSIVHARQRSEADAIKMIKKLQQASAVWIAGGDQQRLFDRYNGTKILTELKQVVERGGIVGGTSAGAAIMSSVMIAGGITKPKLATGWSFLPNIIVDQHFSQRARFERLANAVLQNPTQIGIGIDEATGVLLNTQEMSVIGNGSVYVTRGPQSWIRLSTASK